MYKDTEQSGVTDRFTEDHAWWKPLAWVAGGRMAGAYDARYHPLRYKILTFVFTMLIIGVVVYLVHAHMTDPRNTPLPVPPNN